jgi:hypothetical protein
MVTSIFRVALRFLTARSAAPASKYVRCDYDAVPLLSKGELAFMWPLLQVIPETHRLFCKVRLADIVKVRWAEKYHERSKAFRQIAMLHVDFVLWNRSSFTVDLVIELDDVSHNYMTRKNRDDFVDSVMHSACIPILHVPASPAYDVEELRQQVFLLLNA